MRWGRFWTTSFSPHFLCQRWATSWVTKGWNLFSLSPFHIYLVLVHDRLWFKFLNCQVQNILVYPLWSSPCLLLTMLTTTVLELCLHSPFPLSQEPAQDRLSCLGERSPSQSSFVLPWLSAYCWWLKSLRGCPWGTNFFILSPSGCLYIFGKSILNLFGRSLRRDLKRREPLIGS